MDEAPVFQTAGHYPLTIDPGLVRGWLAARSLARALPAPIADHGGWRVDTGTDAERQRFVFASATPGLAHLAATIDAPAVFLKLCADAATFRALLPPRWSITDANRMMVTDVAPPPRRPLAPGYIATTTRDGDVAHVAITGPAGDLAASGYAAELDGIFVYDRIVTAEAHRRRGLGRVVMTTLATTRRSAWSRQILTATDMGAALYASLGWREYCPYTSAAIV